MVVTSKIVLRPQTAISFSPNRSLHLGIADRCSMMLLCFSNETRIGDDFACLQE